MDKVGYSVGTKRVYLAGPDVFLRDSESVFARKKEICRAAGFEGVSPLDTAIEFPPGYPKAAMAVMIFRSNVGLIRGCHGVLANMNPFRGPSADVGTAWEMGFANALGLPIFAYSESRFLFKDRVLAFQKAFPDEDLVEDFDGEDNLMLDHSVQHILWSFEEAAQEMARAFSL